MSDWMLWGRYGGSVQLGSAPPPRLYFIPLTTSIANEGPLAVTLGHGNFENRNLEAVTRALDRAVSAESDGVVFPSSFFDLTFRDEIVLRCQHRKLRIVHQITSDALASDSSGRLIEALTNRLEAGDAANFVFGGKTPPGAELVNLLQEWPEQVYFTYSVRASDHVFDVLSSLPEYVCARLFFHFPYHTEPGDNHLSCAKINKLILEAKVRIPEIRIRPMLGVELFDPRVDPTLDLEPILDPLIELRSGDGLDHKNRVPIEVSVIIPSYNNRDYLLNTIQHLTRQDLPRSAYEIVVIDDGSSDQTESAVRQLVTPFEGQINFKYIFSPRPAPRKMGDAGYRAGISRNLGVKNAKGKILCFLDSDILTPPGFLSDLVEKHAHFDVVQCKRLNLVLEKSNDSIRFEEIDPSRDTFFTEDDYWKKFYSLQDWSSVPFFWKYTCTYGLSISAKLFKRVGWIRRGFVFYGFEDVELGYRLAQVGARFHLNDMTTYHLFHKNDRSEFRNSDYLRQSLLAKTAQIFYLGRLEPEIFFHFRGLMKEQIPLSAFVNRTIKKLGFQNLPEWMLLVLGFRNWRWLAWRQKNRITAFYQMHLEWRARAWIERLAGSLQHMQVAIERLAGNTWRLRVAVYRLRAVQPILHRFSYPIRKVYYFCAYQYQSRIRSPRSRGGE